MSKGKEILLAFEQTPPKERTFFVEGNCQNLSPDEMFDLGFQINDIAESCANTAEARTYAEWLINLALSRASSSENTSPNEDSPIETNKKAVRYRKGKPSSHSVSTRNSIKCRVQGGSGRPQSKQEFQRTLKQILLGQ